MHDDVSALEAGLDDYMSLAVAAFEAWAYQRVKLPHPPPKQPYQFLYPFEIEDADIFFGRDSATETLYETVLKDRLTVLHARPGTGKTSLLKAGLSPHLIHDRRLPVYARAYSDPILSIKCAIAHPSREPWPEPLFRLPLNEFLRLTCTHLSPETQELVIILDQFEEYLAFWPGREQRERFIDALSACYSDESLPLRFVIALRSDDYSELADFQSHFPTVFSNTFRLYPLTRQEAQAAITGPVTNLVQPITYEQALLDALLDDLSTGGPLLYRSLSLGAARHSGDEGIEPPQLQIVCTRLYRDLAEDEAIITVEAYQELGGAQRLLDGFLYYYLDRLPRIDASTARDVLKALVSSQRTNRLLSFDALCVRLQAYQEDLENVLSTLIDARLLRQQDFIGEVLYELAHEYLIDELAMWFEPSELAFRQAEELLLQEVAAYDIRDELIPWDQLQWLYGYRERFGCLDEETWVHLLRVVLQGKIASEDWAKLVSEISERLLLASLADSRASIRHATLRRLGDMWELPELSELVDEDASVRETAARALGERGDPRTVQPLIAALQDKDSHLRQPAAEGLGEIGDPRAVEPLVAALRDDDSGVRWRAAEALGKIGDPRAVQPLLSAVRDANGAVRWSVAWALCKIGAPAVEPLIAALHDNDRAVRRSATRSLGKVGDVRAVEPLIAALQDQDSTVRRLAAWALHQIGDPRAVRPLIAALRDEDSDVRWSALEALVNIRIP